MSTTPHYYYTSFWFKRPIVLKITPIHAKYPQVCHTATEKHLGILAVKLLLQSKMPFLSPNQTSMHCYITTEERHKNEHAG